MFGAAGFLQLINVHIDPSLSHTAIKRQLRELAHASLVPAAAETVLAGDFNVCAAGEGRLRTRDGATLMHSLHLAHYFQDLFRGYAEVDQPRHAHRSCRGDRAISVGRTDILY
eukprot:6469496-Pyramimonas_sp.AAC.1